MTGSQKRKRNRLYRKYLLLVMCEIRLVESIIEGSNSPLWIDKRRGVALLRQSMRMLLGNDHAKITNDQHSLCVDVASAIWSHVRAADDNSFTTTVILHDYVTYVGKCRRALWTAIKRHENSRGYDYYG